MTNIRMTNEKFGALTRAGISLFVACRHYHAGGVMRSAHRRALLGRPAVLGDK